MSQDTITLQVEPRTIVGKRVKHLRTDGKIPAVIHDHGKDSVNVMGDRVAMHKAYLKAGKHHTIELKNDGKTYTTIIKNITFEPRKNQLSHIVFNAVNKNEKIEAEIPVRPRYAEGNEVSPAERAGLMVISNLDTVLVESIPSKLPDVLEYDAEKLIEVGDHVSITDLNAPEGVVIKTDENQTVASVYEPSAIAAANDPAGGEAEPGDEASVASDHESSAETGTQAPEDAPGGQKQREPKSV